MKKKEREEREREFRDREREREFYWFFILLSIFISIRMARNKDGGRQWGSLSPRRSEGCGERKKETTSLSFFLLVERGLAGKKKLGILLSPDCGSFPVLST